MHIKQLVMFYKADILQKIHLFVLLSYQIEGTAFFLF